MAVIELNGRETLEIRAYRTEDENGEVTLVVRTGDGTLRISAGRTAEDAANLREELSTALTQARNVCEDWISSTADWFAASKAAGCTGTGFNAGNDTIAHENELPCPVHPGL